MFILTRTIEGAGAEEVEAQIRSGARSLWQSLYMANIPTIRFSEHFGVPSAAEAEWFDPLLTLDTKLFVDPFLVYVETDGNWADAHDRLIDFFNMVMELIAQSGLDENSAHWKAAERLLMFPEPPEFCLGYSETSTLGSGSGRGLQKAMMEGASEAIRRGISEVSHFEELTLFRHGIGEDRISDIACNVLKREFIKYTQAVVSEHNIHTEPVNVEHADWSREHRRWVNSRVPLPVNPDTDRAVLLTPKRFLRSLPSVDPHEFWNWAWTTASQTIRAEFNYDIARNVDAREIARLARAYPDLVHEYMEQIERQPKTPYDIPVDPDLRVWWYEGGRDIAANISVGAPENEGDFHATVRAIVDAFAHSVEQDTWRLLWDGDKAKGEKPAQSLFRSTVVHYCKANDIDLSGESNAGRGPVDFKFSAGWQKRALVEVKLASSTQFWHGLEKQLRTYMTAEEVHTGFFVVICYYKNDFGKERRDEIRNRASDVSNEFGVTLEPIFVDARPKPSASNV